MLPIHAIAVSLAALAGAGHGSPPRASRPAPNRPTKSVTFTLPADHRGPLVAVATIDGHPVRLTRPKVHGRHAVSHLTARAMIEARIDGAASRSHATARLFAHGHIIARARFTVPARGRVAATGHLKARRHPRKPKDPSSGGGSTTTGTGAGKTSGTAPGTGTGTGTGKTSGPAPGTGTGKTSGPAPGTGTGKTSGPTPVGAPSLPVVPGATGPLRWAPPVLTNPKTVYVQSGDPDVLNLSTTQDYIVKMPSTPDIGTIEIDGGHNVVIVGGQITVPSTADQTDNGADDTDTGVYIKGSTGTVHIEGMLINGQTNTMFDGIDINAPQATVQIENVRVSGLWGSYTTEHADAIQTWGGVAHLRVDDFTADGDYQGLSVDPNLGSVGLGQFQNVDLTADPRPAALASETSGGGIMLWLTDGNNCNTTAMSFDNVYVNNQTNRIPDGGTIWPQTNSSLPCKAVQSGNQVSWPGLPSISGSVTLGAPPTGSFVPAGSVGVGYATPGYAGS